MMNRELKREGRFWHKRAIFFPIAWVAIIFLLSWVLMLLWNSILLTTIGVKAISFWQSMGILALSKILFSGFNLGHKHRFNRWENINPEEREKMREEWKKRFETETKKK
jgi:Ca2+/H+ antiporter, TMEM165/GDT1 family